MFVNVKDPVVHVRVRWITETQTLSIHPVAAGFLLGKELDILMGETHRDNTVEKIKSKVRRLSVSSFCVLPILITIEFCTTWIVRLSCDNIYVVTAACGFSKL